MRSGSGVAALVALLVGCTIVAGGVAPEVAGSATPTSLRGAADWSGSDSVAAPHLNGMIDASLLLPAERIGPGPSFVETFDGPDRLLTNGFAHWNPTRPDSVSSSSWVVTSGSLFVRDGMGWTGVPDRRRSEPRSELGNGSAVFRALVTADTAPSTSVAMRLRLLGYVDDSTSEDWDGAHVMLRYENEARLYAVSIARRDGTVAIKRKLPGGDSNGGNYLTLGTAKSPVEVGRWHTVTATIADVPSGVEVELWIDGLAVVRAVDLGQGGGVITGPGMVGLRGDNVEMEFDDIVIAPRQR